MKYYIGADLGTSALKLLLTHSGGHIEKNVSREYPVSYPQPAWSEQDPELWWGALVDAMAELMEGIDPGSIGGMSLGGQMHGLVILDQSDRVIRPAILWNDSRTDRETAWLNETVGRETLSRLTANIAFAGFTAPKLLWLRSHEPENFAKIRRVMLPKDYLTYRLTGIHCTDYSDASGTLLLDVEHRCWSREMLDICGISQEVMPRLFESYQPVGGVLPQAARQLGIPAGIPVAAGAGDNAAAALGTGTVANGRCNISLGTSGTIFISSDSFMADPMNALHAFCHADGGYHLMGCILSAASCNKWFCQDILKTTELAAEQADIAEDKLGENHVLFLPYLMGERSPINDTDARGTFVGMRLDTSRADLVQAVLEGVAFAIRDNLEVARSQGMVIERSCLCGGGAKSQLWQKILCNVLNIKIDLPQTEQGPGYGAAMLAMVAAGEYPSVRACADALVQVKTTLTPAPLLAEKYEAQYAKFRLLYPSMKQLFKKLKS